MDMKKRAIQIILDAKGYIPTLCKDIGVDYNWAKKLIGGKIVDPGYRKLQKVIDYGERNVQKDR